LDDFAFGVDGPDLLDNITELIFIDEISFVEDDFVGKGNLFDALIFSTILFFLLEMLNDMFSINNGNDSIKGGIISHILINKESLSDRSRVSHASGFNENGIKRSFFFHKDFFEDLGEIASNSTTDATVHGFNDLLFRVNILLDQMFVNTDLSELVFYHCYFHAVLFSEDMIEECGFARPKKPCQNCDWDFLFLLLHGLLIFIISLITS
jgi:hypothetical protein